jgi:hypothetical protein
MRLLLGACAVSLLLSPYSVTAQQFDEAANFPVGSFDVTPTVDIGLVYDDNVTRADTDTISSWSRIISPNITIENSQGASQFTLAYRLRNQSYFSSSVDNYTDHFLLAQADMELNSRNRLVATLNFEDGHDDRGSNFSIGGGDLLTEPDTYKQSEIDFLYSYGAFNAEGRLDLNFDFRTVDYDINTPEYRARDRELTRLGGTFYYRIGAVTDAVFEARYTRVEYQFAEVELNPLDSDEISYLLGIEWKATAQTAGTVKFGYQEKDFDSRLRQDFTGFDWEIGVEWEPVDYSRFEFLTSSGTNETNGEGNFIRDNSYSIKWNHDWLERLRTIVKVSLNKDTYEGLVGQGFDTRKDDNKQLRASAFYQFRRWLNFEVGYIYEERDSNRDFIDFDRNQFIINALVTL